MTEVASSAYVPLSEVADTLILCNLGPDAMQAITTVLSDAAEGSAHVHAPAMAEGNQERPIPLGQLLKAADSHGFISDALSTAKPAAQMSLPTGSRAMSPASAASGAAGPFGRAPTNSYRQTMDAASFTTAPAETILDSTAAASSGRILAAAADTSAPANVAALTTASSDQGTGTSRTSEAGVPPSFEGSNNRTNTQAWRGSHGKLPFEAAAQLAVEGAKPTMARGDAVATAEGASSSKEAEEQQMRAVFEAFDWNSDGSLDFQEVNRAITNQSSLRPIKRLSWTLNCCSNLYLWIAKRF